jgi:hypothetical protein
VSRRTTKQRRAARRRRAAVLDVILGKLAKVMMSGITAPARRWFTFSTEEDFLGTAEHWSPV